MKHFPLRLALVLILGAVAPFIWVSSLGWWAGYLYTAAIKWIWATFSIKGLFVFVALDVIHAILVAMVFALLLRLVARRAWRSAVAVFWIAFLAAFFGVGFIQSSEPAEMTALLVVSWVGVSVLLIAIAVFSAVLAKYPSAKG